MSHVTWRSMSTSIRWPLQLGGSEPDDLATRRLAQQWGYDEINSELRDAPASWVQRGPSVPA